MRNRLSLLLAITLLMTCLMPLVSYAVSFEDIDGHWAEDYIKQAAERQLIQGYDGKYNPDEPMTRSQLVTILWRASGSPEPQTEATFTDLTQDWYKKPVAWAQENQVVNGVGGGKFDPDGIVTREQLVTVLHRLSGDGSGMELLFASIYDANHSDSDQVSGYAKAAMYWSIYKTIYCGEASTEVGDPLAPLAPASRGQIAVMIVRYLDRS